MENRDIKDSAPHSGHYKAHPSGLEPIDVCQHLPFAAGSAVKYLARWKFKGTPVKDIEKAVAFLAFEIARLKTLKRVEVDLPTTYWKTTEALAQPLEDTVEGKVIGSVLLDISRTYHFGHSYCAKVMTKRLTRAQETLRHVARLLKTRSEMNACTQELATVLDAKRN